MTYVARSDHTAWGRVIRERHEVARPSSRAEVVAALAAEAPLLAVGCGRSYGDVALNPQGRLIDCRDLDRFIGFDRDTGVIDCEAGVTLADILDVACRPDADGSGWFLPVSPGTRYVSIGGAIANDVHGKNHHRCGTFGEHIQSLELLRSDGSVSVCSADQNPDLLRATIGGLGLTGVILSARLRLRRVAGLGLETEHIQFAGLDDFFDIADRSADDWEYTAAWVDCLAKGGATGRGVFSRARHLPGLAAQSPAAPRASVPLEPPFSLANAATLPTFNAVYWRRLAPHGRVTVRGGYEPVLYPLDAIGRWNWLYGPRGFYQFQCVVPQAARGAVRAILEAIAKAGEGSMLTVLKTFADRPAAGMLSFPMAGTTLALDFPNRGETTRGLLRRVEAIALEAGGRIYPAKDSLMSAESFHRGYPELDRFRSFIDPKLSSGFSRRVGITSLAELSK